MYYDAGKCKNILKTHTYADGDLGFNLTGTMSA